jgi:hypothetical protein
MSSSHHLGVVIFEALEERVPVVDEEGRKPKADPMAKRNPVIPGPTHLSRTERLKIPHISIAFSGGM